jgi:hypothetical protein
VRGAEAFAFDRRGGQVQRFLDGQRHPQRPRLRQRELVSVDALVTLGQRRIVGVADEADGDVRLVRQVRQRLTDLLDELLGDRRRLVLVAQRHDEVLDARAAPLAFLVAQLADGLHPADLDALDVVGDDDLLVLGVAAHLVIPDLDLDATILGAALFGFVRSHRLRVAGPLVGDSLGRQAERLLEVLGDLAGALAREALVVPEDFRQRARQLLRVGVPDEMELDVLAVAHAFEDLGQGVDVALRDLRDARFEVDRRHDVLQLDRLELFDRNLLDGQLVAALAVEDGGVLRPAPEGLVGGQMALDRLAGRRRVDRIGGHDGAVQQGADDHREKAVRVHAGHLPSGRGALGRLTGAPRRQKISGSMVSG